MPIPDDEDLLAEQRDYYRARSSEYDAWFLREGRYDHGPEATARWREEVREVEVALEAFAPRGRVLELACGTGWWTERLAAYVARGLVSAITAVDASPEVIARNRARLAERYGAPVLDRTRYVEADLFAWTPEARAYDVVFFSFWLSHVPPARAAEFWSTVRGALAPGGRAFFIDSRREETATSRDQALPRDEASVTLTRSLGDGRRFRIVKVFHDPDALGARLASLGWRADVRQTPTYFIHGHASPER